MLQFDCQRWKALASACYVRDCGATLPDVGSSVPVLRTRAYQCTTTLLGACTANSCLLIRVQEALRIPCATHKTVLSYHLAYTHCAAGRIGDAVSAAAAAAAAAPGDPDAAGLAVLLYQLQYEYDRALRQVEEAAGLGAGAAAVALGVRLGRTVEVREGDEGEAGEEDGQGRAAGAGAGGSTPGRGAAGGVVVEESKGVERTAVAAGTGAGGSEGPGQQGAQPKGSHGASIERESEQELSGEEGAAAGRAGAAAAAATVAGPGTSGAGQGQGQVRQHAAVGAAGQAQGQLQQQHPQAEVQGAGDDRRGRVGSGARMAGGGEEQVHAAVGWQLEALRADPLCVGALAGGYRNFSQQTCVQDMGTITAAGRLYFVTGYMDS